MSNPDLIVIGAGSGGIATAMRAAKHGAKVVLFEPRDLGGTCVNVGCVPKKAMWLAAKLAEAQKTALAVGFASQPGALDWSRYVALRENYIERIHASYASKLAEAGIEWIAESAYFIGENRVASASHVREAKHILIATGARPHVPDIPGAEFGIDSDGFFQLRTAPKRVAVIGGGYIATELAGILHALGSTVEIFVRDEKLLKNFDHETGDELVRLMRARGIGLRFGSRVQGLQKHASGQIALLLEGAASTDGFDCAIWATGRVPNSGSLKLDVAGVRTTKAGYVEVDAWQDTNVAGVHAVGDITGKLALTPVATASGRLLANRLFGRDESARVDFDDVPTVVFGPVPLASVGLGEEAARAGHGDAVRIYTTRFKPMISALSACDEKTFMKIVCVGDNERVVGIHLLGREVDEMLQGFAVALKLGACKRDLEATVAIHPSASEEIVLMCGPARAHVPPSE